ncbi:MAG: dethiobiotin synthase [Mariniblastus sp.]
MLKKPPYGLFVTGTDTEVGKTYVASLITKELVAAGHRVGVYKPAASDCVSDGRQLVSEDAVALWEAATRPLTLDAVCPQRFQAPLAPHLSARNEGRELDVDLMRTGISAWADECDIIVVEGAGGLMSPISDDEYFADLAYEFGYPIIVVSPNSIGVINQTLSALITATCFRDGIPIGGVVLNDSRMFDGDISMETNREQVASRSMAPVLTRLRYDGEAFDDSVDWFEIAKKEHDQQANPAETESA